MVLVVYSALAHSLFLCNTICVLEGRWRAIRSPKTLPIDTLFLAREMACDGEHYDSQRNVSILRCRKNSL